MKVFQSMDGFLWADVTNIAKKLWHSEIFEMYEIHPDKSESLIESEGCLLLALKNTNTIAIELCFLHEITPLN